MTLNRPAWNFSGAAWASKAPWSAIVVALRAVVCRWAETRGSAPPDAAADVVRLAPDLVLRDRQADAGRDDRHDRPDDVRRLARHVERQVTVDGVPVGDAAAGLDAGDVDPG